jgi:hypothetical protein
MAKIKITRYKGASDTGTGKTKNIQVTLANKKGGKTLTRSVTKDDGKKTIERSVVRNLRQGTSVKKTKENGVKTKTYRADADRSGGKIYNGTDRKMFKAANKLNKVIEKRGRAADLQALRPTGETAKSLSKFTSPVKPGAKQSNKIDNKIERLENRKQRIGNDQGMNKRQFERAGDIRKKIYDLNKKRNA